VPLVVEVLVKVVEMDVVMVTHKHVMAVDHKHVVVVHEDRVAKVLQIVILLPHLLHHHVPMGKHKEVKRVILVEPKLRKNVSMENEQML
jgi:hypothetical protein